MVRALPLKALKQHKKNLIFKFSCIIGNINNPESLIRRAKDILSTRMKRALEQEVNFLKIQIKFGTMQEMLKKKRSRRR